MSEQRATPCFPTHPGPDDLDVEAEEAVTMTTDAAVPSVTNTPGWKKLIRSPKVHFLLTKGPLILAMVLLLLGIFFPPLTFVAAAIFACEAIGLVAIEIRNIIRRRKMMKSHSSSVWNK